MLRAALISILLLSTAAPARRAAGRDFQLTGGTLRYTLIHKLHEVVGVCNHPEGRARLLPGGGLEVEIRARADCFNSGNGNRDAHMLEVVEAEKFPYVVLKGVGTRVLLPKGKKSTRVHLLGQLTFHGIERPQEVDVTLTSLRGGVNAGGSFPISLEAFHIERPSLLFVKVDDRVVISTQLSLKEIR